MRIEKNSAALMLLGMEHQRFNQVLDILENQVSLVESGQAADFSLIDLTVDYFLTFPDACHHPKEDLLFARVMAQAPDDSDRVGDLIGEHRELSELTHRTRDELASRDGSNGLSNSALETLKSFLQFYRHHIKTENENFFPYVLEHFTQEEFDIIDFDLFDSEDPVYDRASEARFARLREEIVALGGKV